VSAKAVIGPFTGTGRVNYLPTLQMKTATETRLTVAVNHEHDHEHANHTVPPPRRGCKFVQLAAHCFQAVRQ